MQKLTTMVVAGSLLMLSVAVAHAGGEAGSIGVGADIQLNGLTGVSVNYDAGKFHAGGVLGLADGGGDNDTTIAVGGRFFWHLHSTASADFSAGGQVGLVSAPPNGGPATDNVNALYLEPAFQIRAFITPNVALNFTGGVSLGTMDASGFVLGAYANGSAGVHYYF